MVLQCLICHVISSHTAPVGHAVTTQCPVGYVVTTQCAVGHVASTEDRMHACSELLYCACHIPHPLRFQRYLLTP